MFANGQIISLGLTKGDRLLKYPYAFWQHLAGLYFKDIFPKISFPFLLIKLPLTTLSFEKSEKSVVQYLL